MKLQQLLGSLGMVAFLAVGGTAVIGCDNKPDTAGDKMEKAGDRMENAADKTGEKMNDAANTAGDKMEKAGDKMDDKMK